MRKSDGRQPTGVIAQLKDKIDITAEYVKVDDRGRGSCPWHGPDHHPSFLLSRADGYFIDFHDGTGGDAIEFYRRMEALTPREAIRRLARRFL